MTTLIWITAAQIEPHPLNPRRTVGDVSELAESIAAHGIIHPLVVAPGPRPHTCRLIAGHRRAAANAIAYPDEDRPMAALLREDLDDDAKQLEAILVENLNRSDLTPVEEATAYAQLRIDFGYQPADIARRTGRRKSTVDRRLSLMRLPEAARERLHGGQMSLAEAECLVEFAGDPDALADLEKYVGTPNFNWRVNYLRGRRDVAAAHRRAVAEAEQAGMPIVQASGPSWPWNRSDEHATVPVHMLTDEQLRDGHAEHCPHHVLVEVGETLTPACADPAVHGSAAPGATPPWESLPDLEGERIRAELAAAAATRRQFVDGLLAGKLTAEQRRTALAAVVALTMVRLGEDGDDHAYNEVADRFGMAQVSDSATGDTRNDQLRDMAITVGAWPVDQLVKAALAVTLPAFEPELAHQWSWRHVGARVLLDSLTRLGYSPCDLERDLLTPESTKDTA